jgi:hypothetical protein
MDVDVRKTVIHHEIIEMEGGGRAASPVTRVAGCAVFTNPYSGQDVDDISALFKVGYDLGERLMARMLPLFDRPVVSYGKAAVVGVNGDLEHGHALLHPALGKAMREPIGGGEALIASAAKVGAAGATMDMPMGHKDEAWSFDHFDAISVAVSDSPRPDEIMMIIGLADAGRTRPRCGQGRVNV